VGDDPDLRGDLRRVNVNYQRLYEYRFRNVDQEARTAVWQEIAPFIHRQMGSPERVLDPAAGRGEFINAVPASERWAIDQVAYAEGTYDAGVHSVVSDVFAAELPEAHFDGVWVSNFLEHLLAQEAVATFLEKMRDAMAVDGRIAIMGPKFPLLLEGVLRQGGSHADLHPSVDCGASLRGRV